MKSVLAATAVVIAFSAAQAENLVHPTTVTPVGSHACAGFYPEAAREAHIGGVAGMAFTITPTGAVSDVAVVQSSGNGDLDDAAKSCVRTWRYQPVQDNGKPVAAAWKAEVEFKAVVPVATAPAVPVLPVMIEQDRDACLHYPFWAQRRHAEGNATLKYTISPEGAVSDVVMTKASGDKDLDEAALTCVKSFKFRPLPAGAAAKTVAARATWSYLEHAPSVVRWQYAGSTTAVIDAARGLKGGVTECLKQASSHSEFASGFAGVTTVRLRLERGSIRDVSVLSGSGNDDLDHFASACYRAEAADPVRAEALRHVGSSVFKIVWRQLIPS